jgi:hypothetical protein
LLKNRYEGQCDIIVDPDMSPHSYAHQIFDKGAKNIKWREEFLFKNLARKTGSMPEEN